MWIRVLPFAVFMGFIGIKDGVLFLVERGWLTDVSDLLDYLYPVKIVLVAAVLLFLWPRFHEMHFSDLFRWRDSLLSIVTGVVIFVLWIHMDWPFATFGSPQGFSPDVYGNGLLQPMMIATRFLGSFLVVPVMEELFWRSFLIRYLINEDFLRVDPGRFTWASFMIVTIFFGLEHHLFLAGMIAGALFNLLLYRTRSIAQCILSHGVANFALGIYVLQAEQWQFW